MFKSVDQLVAAAALAAKEANASALAVATMTKPARREQSRENANSAFKALHGFYGSLFLIKFATGKLDHEGRDAGVLDAQEIWAYGLREFANETVQEALMRLLDSPKHREFPPSLPEFRAICRDCAPVAVYKSDEPLKLGLSQSPAVRAERAANNRELVRRYRFGGRSEAGPGLDALKQAIADAVATAGGDEAAVLRRLDWMSAPRAAAQGAQA